MCCKISISWVEVLYRVMILTRIGLFYLCHLICFSSSTCTHSLLWFGRRSWSDRILNVFQLSKFRFLTVNYCNLNMNCAHSNQLNCICSWFSEIKVLCMQSTCVLKTFFSENERQIMDSRIDVVKNICKLNDILVITVLHGTAYTQVV